MENKLEKQVTIPISCCDNHALLNITGIFELFMDLATEHGDMLGLGMDKMSDKGLFWVASKTKIKIKQMPSMLSTVSAATWPETPSRIRCNRYYCMYDGKNILAEGKTEWVVVEKSSGKPVRIDGIYPVEMSHCTDVVCQEPFYRLSSNFDDCPEIKKYTVCSNDIDVSQHMNNVAYVRAVLGAFTTKEIDQMHICEIDVSYRVQCFEGENLSLRIKRLENYIEIGVIKEDSSTACIVRFTCSV